MKSVLNSKKHPADPELLLLKAELRAAQGELSFAYRQFDQALAPELIDCCIYEINACLLYTSRCV